MNLNIRLINNNDDFASIKVIWEELELKSNNKNLMSSYQWQKTWWNIFQKVHSNSLGFDKKLNILLVYRESILVAIFPLVRLYRKILFLKIKFIEFNSQQWGGTYLDILNLDLNEIEIKYVFSYLKKTVQYDLLYLRYIPQYTENFNLNSKNANIFSCCYEIDLKRKYDEVTHKIYSYNLRRAITKFNNKIEREKVAVKGELVSGLSSKKTFFNKCKIVSLTKDSEEGKNSFYKDDFKSNFVEKFFFNSEKSYLSFFSHDENILSYNIGTIYNNKIFAFDASINRSCPEMRTYGLGVLTYDLIVQKYSEDCDSLCMGPGIDKYKTRFTKKFVKIFSYCLKGNSFFSSQYLKFFQLFLRNKERKYVKHFKIENENR